MTQANLKQLVKLLTQWEGEVAPSNNSWEDDKGNIVTSQKESQPLYGEVIRLVINQVKREIE